MKKLQFSRRSVSVALSLLVALTLVLAGLSRGPGSEASAATASPSPSVTVGHTLKASQWSPADGATGVAVDVSISVHFNYTIAAATLTSSTFYIQKAGSSTHLPATLNYNSVTGNAILRPDAALLPGTSYHVTLTSGVKDTQNYALSNPSTWTFTTDQLPTIASKIPLDYATNVPLNQTISIVFGSAMDPTSFADSSFYMEKSAGGGHIPAAITISADKKTATLDPTNDLQPSTEYVVTLTPAIESMTHVALGSVNTHWWFTTTTGAPSVTQKTPADAATGVTVTGNVVVTFDQDMDASTLTTATMYIQKSGGTPLPATVAYASATRTVTLQPLASLEAGATYQVTLSAAVKSANGAVLSGAPLVWSFTTAATAPTVTAKVPAAGATDVSPTQVVSATFDREMDLSTLTSATFYIQKSGGTPLPATVAYNASTKTVTLDPLADLESGATYQVTLSTAVRSSDNQTLAGAPVVWTFTTQAGHITTFTDVTPGVTPYATAIAALAADGVVTGFADGTFRPFDSVSRQQFAKMIVLALGLTVTGNEVCPFVDVPARLGTDPFYPSKYVAVCAAQGITAGKTPTKFGGFDIITRQQLITMVVRAAKLSSPPSSYTPPFSTGQFSPSSHYQNARKASYAGLLDDLIGINRSYDFFGEASRGECAQLLFNLMTLMAS